MKILLLMALGAVTLSACTVSTGTDGGPKASPAALAALPEGIDPGFLIQGENGCYGIALEASATPTGIPLRDANGQQVCDGDGAV